MLEIDAATNYRRVKEGGDPENEVWVRMGGAGTIIFSGDPFRATPASEVSEISWKMPGALGSVVERIRWLSEEAPLSQSRRILLNQTAAYLDGFRKTMAESFLME